MVFAGRNGCYEVNKTVAITMFQEIEIGKPFENPVKSGFVEMPLLETGKTVNQIEEIIPETKNQLLEGMKTTAKFAGKQAVATAETAMSLSSGALLWPFSKVWGTLNLPFGADAAKQAESEIQKLGYQPYTDEGKAAVELIGKGFDMFLTPSKMAGKSMEKYSPRAAYLLEFGSELAQFAMTGGAVRSVRAKVKPKFETQAEVVPTEARSGKPVIEKPIKEDVPKEPFKDIVEQTKDLPVEKAEGFKEIPIEEPIKPKAEFKEILIEEKASLSPKESAIDVQIDQRIATKYRHLYERPESRLSNADYQNIIDMKRTPKTLDKKIKKVNNKEQYIIKTEAAIADLLGELHETYKYEGFKEGKAIEAYIDSLLDVVEKYKIPRDPLSDKITTTPTIAKTKSVSPDRGIKHTIQDINDLLGERGELGDVNLSTKQIEALNRLRGDAAKAKKSVEEFLIEMKVDPKVAALMGQKAEALKKYAGSINLEKQDIPDSFKQFETVIQEPKKVQTWDQTGELSKEILSDYNKASDVLIKKGEAFTAVEIDAVRQMNVNAISKLKEILETKPEQFEEQYSKYKTDIFDTLNSASSEAGRALNIHKKDISVNRLANAFSKLKRGLNERELKEFKDLNLENPLEVKRFMDRLGDPKLSDYFLEYWYNSILSGPPTHAVNAVGNTAWMLYQVPHKAISAMVDLPYAKLTGKPRTRYINEILPMLLGFKTGFVRGSKMAGQMVRHGKIQEFESKWAQEMHSALGAFERSPNAAIRKIAPFINPPTRALRAMDAWANAMAYDAHAQSLARRSSNELGLKGKERTAAEQKFVENLTQEQHLESMQEAKNYTFMDDPDPVTELIIKARNTPVMGPLLKFTVLPFVNTISNLMKRGAELTPGVGLIKEGISRGMGRGKNTPDVIAKQIEGAVIAAYVWDKIQKDEITGSMPERKSEREAWYRSGKLPYAIKMGDTWISYRRAEPYNTVIASAHAGYEAALGKNKQEDIDAIFFDVANRMKDNIIDGSYLQGMQAVMNRHQKSEGAVARWGSSWVPYSSFLRSMSRAYEVVTEGNAKARETGKAYQAAFSQVLPWLIDKPPAKLDVWGNESVIPGGVFRQWLPFKWATAQDDPVEKELEKLGYFPSVPSDTVKIKGEYVKLDEDIYRKFVVDYGSKAKKRLHRIITNPNYQRVSKLNTGEDRHKTRLENEIQSIRYLARRKAILEQTKRNK